MSIAVSVFIVNYNGAAFLKNCLDSVLASKVSFKFEVIIIDNLSTDDSLACLEVYKGKVKVLKNHHNSGFSKANNIAASYASGEYYFLLNNDTVVPEDTLQLMYDYMIQHDDIGALVPRLLNEDGSIQCPGSILGHWRFKSKKIIDVPFVAGAALLMKADVYDRIGGLDDNLFFYNDDVDLCKVLKNESLRLVYFPLASLIHFGGLSTQFRKIGSLIEGYRGGFYVCRKHYGSLAYQLYRIFVLVDVLPRLLIHLICSLWNTENKEYVGLYIKVLRLNWDNDIYVHHPLVHVEEL